MAFAYMGKIVEVNLDTNEIELVPTERYADMFLGGRGVASRIYWEELNRKQELLAVKIY